MSRLIREHEKYESRFPLYKWKITCWAQMSASGKRFKGHIIVWASSYREAVLRADIWGPLVISVELIKQEQ